MSAGEKQSNRKRPGRGRKRDVDLTPGDPITTRETPDEGQRRAVQDGETGLLREPQAKPDAPREAEDQPDAGTQAIGGPAPAKQDGTAERVPAVQRLLDLAADAECFHTPDGVAYADVRIREHRETMALDSAPFSEWLARSFYVSEKRSPPAAAVKDVQSTLKAKARFDGPERPVFLRTGHAEECIYLDLANANWEAVEVTQNGWRIVPEPPIRFRRERGTLALPRPEGGGDTVLLRPFVNLADEDDWRLLLAWIVAALRPKGPYPVLVLHGEQGTAKSTTARVLRALVDPNSAPLRTKPKEERDLFIGANNAWIVAMDNLSGISPELSDALCRLATGGGFATRELYSNAGETILDCTRPVMLTGIDALTVRGDLADRAVVLTLPPLKEGQRQPEKDFWDAFTADAPRMLGALLDAHSGVLRNVGRVTLPALPRMADFAVMGVALERALRWPDGAFMKAYERNRAHCAADAVEGSPVARALSRLAAKHGQGWSGTATHLLAALSQVAPFEERGERWPRSANALSNQIQRSRPALRQIGVEIELRREGRERTRMIAVRMAPGNDRPHRPPRTESRGTGGKPADDDARAADDGASRADDRGRDLSEP